MNAIAAIAKSIRIRPALPPLAACLLTAAPGAGAQQPAVETAEAERAIEAIFVTARKREESAQDISLSVSAYDEEAIRRRSLGQLEDVAMQTPGLAFEDFSNGGYGLPVIRGATQFNVQQLEQNVSVFLDGIYVPRQYAFDLGLANTARIEVVKGPQSALYGANAFAGAINYVSRAPEYGGFTGNLEGTFGNAGRNDYMADINIPLAEDRLALRLGASNSGFDGDFANNHPNAGRLANARSDETLGGWEKSAYSIGVAALLDSVELKLDWRRFVTDSEEGAQFVLTRGNGDTNCSPTLSGFPVPRPNNALFCGELPVTPVPGPSGVPGLVRDPRNIGLDLETEMLRGEIDWRIGERSRIDYIFGNISSDVFSVADSSRDALTGTPNFFVFPPVVENIFASLPTGDFDYRSHELRYEYESDAGFYLTLGAYLLDGEDNDIQVFRGVPLAGTEPITSVTPRPPIDAEALTETERRSLFGRAELPFSDGAFVLGLEARITRESKDLSDRILRQGFSYEDDYFTPRVTLDYNLSADRLLYASAAKGVKSGGINISGFTGLLDSERFYAPDENVTYEIGSKNVLADGNVTLNAALFLIDWSNLQTLTLPTGAPTETAAIVTNLGSAESRGVEIAAAARLSDSFTVNGGVSWIDATYGGGTRTGRVIQAGVCDGVVCARDGDVSGRELARSPATQWNVGAEYSGQVSADIDFFLRADLTGQSEMWVSELNLATVSPRRLLSLRAGFGWNDFSLDLWATNAFDEEYVSNAFFIANRFTVDYRPTLGPPRRYGATLRYSF